MNPVFIEVFRLIELFSVACVVFATIYLLQHLLTKAHMLLRAGLALICIASVLEFYITWNGTGHCDNTATMTSVAENVGQAAVYVWAATSRRLWRIMDAIYRTRQMPECCKED